MLWVLMKTVEVGWDGSSNEMDIIGRPGLWRAVNDKRITITKKIQVNYQKSGLNV